MNFGEIIIIAFSIYGAFKFYEYCCELYSRFRRYIKKKLEAIIRSREATIHSNISATNHHIDNTNASECKEEITLSSINRPIVYLADNPHNLPDNLYVFSIDYVYDTTVKCENGDIGSYTFRAYIVRMPDLRGRDPNGHITHRWFDNTHRLPPWICWDTALTNKQDMYIICRIWANSLQEYIATGKAFGEE